MFKSAWLLDMRSPKQPSASDPPKAIIVSELFVLSLSSMFPASSMWESRSLTSPACPTPPLQVVIVWVLYVAQHDWYLFPIFPSMVLSGEYAHLLLLLWCHVMCRGLYGSGMVESHTRQEQW